MTGSQNPPRPYLVFVRAGAQSHHRRLIAEDPSRNWDCCVSWSITPPDEHLAEYYCAGGYNKFDGFLEFWKQRPQPWTYRYILLLDDDVYLRPGDVSSFLKLCDRHCTYVSQPALRWFTHTTHKLLARNPVCILRRVSFIEVMAPCFASAALENLVHTFAWTRSTRGIDWAWAHLLEGKETIHVVDEIGMDHTRNHDGRPSPFYTKLKALGVDPKEDERRIRQMFPSVLTRRTLPHGHVFRPGIDATLAPLLLRAVEYAKIVVSLRKQFLRQWRRSCARLDAS